MLKQQTSWNSSKLIHTKLFKRKIEEQTWRPLQLQESLHTRSSSLGKSHSTRTRLPLPQVLLYPRQSSHEAARTRVLRRYGNVVPICQAQSIRIRTSHPAVSFKILYRSSLESHPQPWQAAATRCLKHIKPQSTFKRSARASCPTYSTAASIDNKNPSKSIKSWNQSKSCKNRQSIKRNKRNREWKALKAESSKATVTWMTFKSRKRINLQMILCSKSQTKIQSCPFELRMRNFCDIGSRYSFRLFFKKKADLRSTHILIHW